MSSSSTTAPITWRVGTAASLLSPALLLGYAGARWVDGLDGSDGPGVAWDAGHWAFLVAMLGFGVVMLALRGLLAEVGWPRLAAATTAIGLVGVGLFAWVILGDLFPSFDERFELPDPLMALGPLLLMTGLLVPLVVLAGLGPRVVPMHAPVAVTTGFVLIAVELDLLALAAMLFGRAAGRPGAMVKAGRGLGVS